MKPAELDWINHLAWFEKLGIAGSIASLLGLIPLILLFVRVIRTGPLKALHEFWFVFATPVHFALTAGVGLLFASLLLNLSEDRILLVTLSALGITSLFLFLSVFIRQNKSLLRQVILNRIEQAARHSQQVCAAIKFDIDLIVAINDSSNAVGHAIINLVNKTLKQHEKGLRARKIRPTAFQLPESDEVIWILPEILKEQAADIADSIRREIKSGLSAIAGYDEVKQSVIRKLNHPPLNDEEKEGIGTLSAGVAGYTRGAIGLLSDISTAVKQAKFRGRNRTIVYRHGEPAIVREH